MIRTKFKSFFSVPAIIGMIAGAAGGLVYYLKVGCHSGSCPIWSNPWLSVLWGAVAGYLIGDLFVNKKHEGT